MSAESGSSVVSIYEWLDGGWRTMTWPTNSTNDYYSDEDAS